MLFAHDDLIDHASAKLLDEDAFEFDVFCCVMVFLILCEVYLIVASIRAIATCLFESEYCISCVMISPYMLRYMPQIVESIYDHATCLVFGIHQILNARAATALPAYS